MSIKNNGKSNENLHGFVPDSADTALLLIDVINDLDFEGNEGILPFIDSVSLKIAALKKRMKAAGLPAIYVNDNFNKWQSNFQNLLDHCLNDDVPGKDLAGRLQPEKDDYFVLKPKHSGFYCTPLELLLEHLGAKNLVLAGIAGNICVLFTANDAYMRGYQIFVPSDCTASNSVDENQSALAQMKLLLKADTRASDELVYDLCREGAAK